MPTRVSEIFFDLGRARAPDVLYDAPHWYACLTRSRHEQKVDSLLRRQAIETYLPTTVRVSQWKDRRKLVHFPLFPGYVFCSFTLHQLMQVVSTHGVARVVSTGGYPTPIPATEIESIRVVQRAVPDGTPEISPAALLQKGNWVRVATGPFNGVQGMIIERRGRKRVLVSISVIGQALEVDIGAADLVPIPDPL
ncbi:MAG TPA: UpxY family transcription antiterminator [Longimicrobium sp.]|nr:UpxY family transcription antiterminator [Longimicrobium sp.]